MDEISCEAGGISIFGRSSAGHESYYRVPSFRASLEAGRGPDALVALPFLLVTHAHLDHAAGIATYASQRTLLNLDEGSVALPAGVAEEFSEILERHRRLEGVTGPYRARIIPVVPGDRLSIRNDLVVRVEPAPHRVPSVGYTFLELRHKLRADLRGAPEELLAARRRGGEVIAESVEMPLLSYSGDCSAEIFSAAPAIFRSRVLLLECTFLRPDHEEKARRYGHVHLADIAAHAALFENDAIVLTHFSASYSREEVLARLADGLPTSLRERTTAFV
jgi:ribonuclease Z